MQFFFVKICQRAVVQYNFCVRNETIFDFGHHALYVRVSAQLLETEWREVTWTAGFCCAQRCERVQEARNSLGRNAATGRRFTGLFDRLHRLRLVAGIGGEWNLLRYQTERERSGGMLQELSGPESQGVVLSRKSNSKGGPPCDWSSSLPRTATSTASRPIRST
jgi:hypothetical protein